MDNKFLNKLKGSTKYLVDYIANGHNESDIVYYEMGSTRIKSTGIYKTDNIAIAITEIPAGSRFPIHKHDGTKEYFMIESGELTITFKDKHDVIVKKGECFIIEANDEHGVYTDIDTLCVMITMPADRGFPNARR